MPSRFTKSALAMKSCSVAWDSLLPRSITPSPTIAPQVSRPLFRNESSRMRQVSFSLVALDFAKTYYFRKSCRTQSKFVAGAPAPTLCRGRPPSAARRQSAGADHARGVFRDVVGSGLDMAGDQGASLPDIAADGGLHQGPVLTGLVARMRPEQRRQIAVALGAIEQRISHGQQCRRA